MAVGILTITPKRFRAIDFLPPIAMDQIGILVHTASENNLQKFLRPFHSITWMCLLGALLLMTVVTFGMATITIRENGNNYWKKMLITFYKLHKIMCQQGK